MKFKGHVFSLEEGKVTEQTIQWNPLEDDRETPYFLFLETRNTEEPSDLCEEAGRLVREAINDVLMIDDQGFITEKKCQQALEYAHSVLKAQNEAKPWKNILSTAVIATPATPFSSNSNHVIFACAGDVRLSIMRPKTTEILFAPLSGTATELGGVPKPEVITFSETCEGLKRFLIESASLSTMVSNEERYQAGLKPHHPSNGMYTLLQQSGAKKGKMATVTFAFNPAIVSQQAPISNTLDTSSTNTSKPRYAVLGLSIATVALTALLTVSVFFNKAEEPKEIAQTPLKQELEEKSKVAEQLQSQVATLEATNAQLKEKITSQENYLDKLRHRTQVLSQSESGEHLDQLITDLENGQAELEKAKWEKEKLKHSLAEAEEKLKTIEEEYTFYRDNTETSLATTTDEVMDLKRSNYDLEQRSMELSNENGKLQEQVALLQTSLQEKETYLAELQTQFENTSSRLSKISVEADEQEKLVKLLQNSESARSELLEKFDTLQTEREELQNKISQLQASLENEKIQSEKNEADFKTDIGAELAKRERVEHHLEDLQASLKKEKEEASRLITANQDLTDKLNALHQVQEELQAKLKISETKEQVIASLRETLQNKEREITRFKANEETFANQIDQIKQEKRDLLEGKTDALEKLAQYDQIQTKYIQQQRETLAAKREVRRLKEQLSNRSQTTFAANTTPQKGTLTPAFSSIAYQETSSEAEAIREANSSAGPISSRVHLVANGETLSGIAKRYYGSAREWRKIYEANKSSITNKDNVRVGTKLVIP